jgi:hypothetical protein
LTSYYKFYYVHDVGEPAIKEFLNMDQTKEIPHSWLPLPPRYTLSGKVEIHYTLFGSGVGVLIEDEKKKIIFSAENN